MFLLHENVFKGSNNSLSSYMEERLDAAARSGDIAALYSLIKEDAFVLERIEEVPFIDTPLHTAASAGQVHFAMEIMRLKPSFARKLNQNGYSPVHLALQNKQTKLISRLLDVEGDLVRVQGREGKTPLHFAVECGMVDVLAEFLTVCPKSIQDLTIRNETALHVAVKSDKLEALKVLLECLEHVGKDGVLEWRDDEGNAILHVAASRNQIEVVNSLIAHGVDVNAANMAGMTALNISQQPNGLGNPEIRGSLIAAGASEAASLPRNINSSVRYLRRDERLKGAAKAGDTSALYSLIQKDACILDQFDDATYAETPLHIAARLGHFSFAMEIMRWKPSFAKKPNQDGLCPIHLATINGHVQTLKQLLILDKSLVQLQGRDGKTSLHYAAEKGDTLLLGILLSSCPLSIEDVTDQSDTALHLAIKRSQFGAFYFLLRVLLTAFHRGSMKQEKKVLNSQDEEGNTLLHIAVQMDMPQVVQQLMDSGVEVNVKNAEGLTALDVSREDQAQIRKTLRKTRKSRESSNAGDNWTSKISPGERIVRSVIRYKRGISTNLRSLILVVSVLIATIAYQTAVTPPTKKDDDKSISCILTGSTNSSSHNTTATNIICSMQNSNTTTSDRPLVGGSSDILFWTSNIIALLGSLLTIFFLVPRKYTVIMSIPLYFFVYCYAATVGITGSAFWSIITFLSFTALYAMLCYVDYISKKIKHKESSVLATAREYEPSNN